MPISSLLNQFPALEITGKRPTPDKPRQSSPCRLEERDEQYDIEDGSSANSNSISQSGSSSPYTIRSRVKGRISPTQSDSSYYDEMGDRLPLLQQRSDSFDSDESGPSQATPTNKAGKLTSMLPWFKMLGIATVVAYLLWNAAGVFLDLSYFPSHGYMLPGGLKRITVTPVFDYVPSPQNVGENSPNHIPRIVHVTYKSREELPPEWQYSLEQWEKVHPDWEIRFWSDKDIYEFVHNEYPEMEALHQSYKYMIQRVDSVRYMILHHYGGVYSDMDIYPATSLDKLLQQWEDAGKNVLLAETSNMGVTNAFMASAPKSRFMKCAVENLPNYQHAFHHWIHWQHWEILSSAGSTFLWGMVGHCHDDQVAVMAAESFRGCSVCWGRDSCDTEWLHHSSTNSSWHVHTSWYHAVMFFVTYSYLCHPFRTNFITVLMLMILIRYKKILKRVIVSK